MKMASAIKSKSGASFSVNTAGSLLCKFFYLYILNLEGKNIIMNIYHKYVNILILHCKD